MTAPPVTGICRFCGSDDLAPWALKTRDYACRACNRLRHRVHSLKYAKTAKGIAVRHRYLRSAKGKAVKAKYQRTEKRRAVVQRYVARPEVLDHLKWLARSYRRRLKLDSLAW